MLLGHNRHGRYLRDHFLLISLQPLLLFGLSKNDSFNSDDVSAAALHVELVEAVYVKSPTKLYFRAASFGDYEGRCTASRPLRRLGHYTSLRPCRRWEPSDDGARRTITYYLPRNDRYAVSYIGDILAVGYRRLPLESTVSCRSCSLSRNLGSYCRLGRTFCVWGELYSVTLGGDLRAPRPLVNGRTPRTTGAASSTAGIWHFLDHGSHRLYRGIAGKPLWLAPARPDLR